MGNISAKLKGDHTIYVQTGDRKGAGTDANIWIIVHDEVGARTPPVKLSSVFANDHERGDINKYFLPKVEEFKTVAKIEFWRDTFGFSDDWFVDFISVEHRKEGTIITFPLNRWIKPNKRYTFCAYDCGLPQHEDNVQQRNEELSEKLLMYEYTQNIDGGPVQGSEYGGCVQLKRTLMDPVEYKGLCSSKMNRQTNAEMADMQLAYGSVDGNARRAARISQERYSNRKWDMKTSATRLKLDAKLIGLTSEKWSSLQDLKHIFKLKLDEPLCLSRWHDDKWFASQRLQGVNPCMIKLCKEVPTNLDVDDEMLKPFLEEMSLQEALQANKLFICDLKIMRNLPCKDDKMICAPIALFYLNKEGTLLPIAIQLFQEKNSDNPVFLPSDPPYTWMLAKMFYNNADANYHQCVLHIGKTHLMMESFWVCTNRNLSPSHPLYKLLAPHFHFMLAINCLLLEKFMAMGGWMDRVTTCGMRGMCSLISR
ncbi:Allene oxide synthase-lipoxygenase protein [Nymphon striatum]|nr:Allene oxide synthase-lipoxygenase protein [Nymphon striatum]